MELFKSLGAIVVSSVLVNNYVLTRFLGICPFLGVSKKTSGAVGMGVAVTVVMLLSSLLTYPLQKFVLVPLGLEFLQTVLFILVIASFVQLLEAVIKKFLKPLYLSLGVYLPLITTNCAVLGVCINNINDGYGFLQSIVSALGCGLGFLLAMVMFSGVRSKMDSKSIPEPFRDSGAALIAASIVSLAFFGFGGIADNLFS